MNKELLDMLAGLVTRLHAGAEGSERQLWLARLLKEEMTVKEERLCHMLERLSEAEYDAHKSTYWLTLVVVGPLDTVTKVKTHAS
jgi:hypothetical protein